MFYSKTTSKIEATDSNTLIIQNYQMLHTLIQTLSDGIQAIYGVLERP